MKKTREEADLTRQRILAAALRLFSTQGYEKTSLDRIAVMAGVTRGAVYWHFANKNELFWAVIREGEQQMFARLSRNIEHAGSALQKVEETIRSIIGTLQNDPASHSLIEIILLKATRDQTVNLSPLNNFSQNLAGIFRDILANGVINKDLPADFNVQGGAMALVCQVIGLTLQWLLAPDLINIDEHIGYISSCNRFYNAKELV